MRRYPLGNKDRISCRWASRACHHVLPGSRLFVNRTAHHVIEAAEYSFCTTIGCSLLTYLNPLRSSRCRSDAAKQGPQHVPRGPSAHGVAVVRGRMRARAHRRGQSAQGTATRQNRKRLPNRRRFSRANAIGSPPSHLYGLPGPSARGCWGILHRPQRLLAEAQDAGKQSRMVKMVSVGVQKDRGQRS